MNRFHLKQNRVRAKRLTNGKLWKYLRPKIGVGCIGQLELFTRIHDEVFLSEEDVKKVVDTFHTEFEKAFGISRLLLFMPPHNSCHTEGI